MDDIINQNSMKQSQKFLKLQYILSQAPVLKNLLNLIRGIASKHDDFQDQEFTSSQHLKFLIDQMNKLHIAELNQTMQLLKEPRSIVALPIKMEPKFTLFFVLVPNGKKFDWHSHPKMTGISKCIYGHLNISTMDIHCLEQKSNIDFIYPKSRVRFEDLYWNSATTVTTIQPHALNIHKIQARQFSAFFDLLMPDYPEGKCQFFTTISESKDQLFLQELFTPSQQIKGWDVALDELIISEKHIVQNYILK